MLGQGLCNPKAVLFPLLGAFPCLPEELMPSYAEEGLDQVLPTTWGLSSPVVGRTLSSSLTGKVRAWLAEVLEKYLWNSLLDK